MPMLRIKLDAQTFEALAFAAVRSRLPLPCLAETILRGHFGAACHHPDGGPGTASTGEGIDRPTLPPVDEPRAVSALTAA